MVERSNPTCDPVEVVMPQVHQAAGMLSVMLDTTCDAALVDLVDYADQAGRPVLDIALQVISRRLVVDDRLPGGRLSG